MLPITRYKRTAENPQFLWLYLCSWLRSLIASSNQALISFGILGATGVSFTILCCLFLFPALAKLIICVIFRHFYLQMIFFYVFSPLYVYNFA